MSEIKDPEIFRTILDNLQAGVCLTDCERKILFWNEGAQRITGYQRHEVVGQSLQQNILPHCDGNACASCTIACPTTRAVHEGKSIEARVEIRHNDGHHLPIRVWFVPIRDQHGVIVAVAQSFNRHVHEPDQRRQQNLAMHGCLDTLTGIPNHEFTEFHLRENLESFTKYQLPFGIMVLQVDELDHFQSIYGREAVDAIMRVFAHTIKDGLRPNDFLGRWTRERFLTILVNSSAGGVTAAAGRINKMVAHTSMQWWGDELIVKTSLGYASVQAGDDIQSLLERAQLSLQHAQDKRVSVATAAKAPSSTRS